MTLHIKFDQDWPTGFRDIEVQKCEIFVTQGQVTPYWVVWFSPKLNLTKLLCLSWLPEALKMIWSKMNKLAWRHHFPIISLYEKFFRPSNSSEILWMSLLPASTQRIQWKATEKRWRHHFPHYKSMGAFCCHGHQCFDPICLKTLCSLSPPPVMLHIKFDQDWPTDLRDIQVRKCKIFIIQGQLILKWVVWSGLKSNSSQLLCLSWLPATLMMIRSKMNKLAWRQHFPIISQPEIF